ncbi:MAG: hypothetical protein SGJ00_00610 [bacterium]|nr:hypothetical protein [bacterium]
MKIIHKLSLLLLFAFLQNSLIATSIVVPSGVDWIRQNNALNAGQASQVYNTLDVNISNGDSLLLVGGNRNPMRIDNLLGDSLNPIVICNQNSQVIFTKPIGGYYGLSFSNCRYIKLSGKNNPSLAYGILITQVPLGSALSINYFSSNFEVEGLEVSRVSSSGMVAKTDMNCSNILSYTSFVMYDLRFHHNYIHHVGNEGFYIGNTSYADGAGAKLTCTNPAFNGNVLPHKIMGVKVYENIVDSAGWDGIQVAAAEAVEIYDNYVINDSWADVMNQQSGIFIGQPSQAKVYRNIIKNGKGSGIQCFGVGTSIYNNLIINPGNSAAVRGTFNNLGQLVNSSLTYGIYINDKVCKDVNVPKLPYLVAHNTILIPKIYRVGAPYNTWAPQGINGNSFAYIFNSQFVNNLILIDTNINQTMATPINGIYASNSVPNYSTVFAPSFISVNNKSTLGNNFYSNEIQAVNFNNFSQGDYGLQGLSTAVDAGVGSIVLANSFLNRDLVGVSRPQGSLPDFGALEYLAPSNTSSFLSMFLMPNPLSISLSQNQTFELVLGNNSLLGSLTFCMINATGYASQSLTVLNDQTINGQRIFTFSGANLPNQSGVYSVQLKENGVLKAFANLLLLP